MASLQESAWALRHEFGKTKAKGTLQGVLESQDAVPVRRPLLNQCMRARRPFAVDFEEIAAPLLPSLAALCREVPCDAAEVAPPVRQGPCGREKG